MTALVLEAAPTKVRASVHRRKSITQDVLDPRRQSDSSVTVSGRVNPRWTRGTLLPRLPACRSAHWFRPLPGPCPPRRMLSSSRPKRQNPLGGSGSLCKSAHQVTDGRPGMAVTAVRGGHKAHTIRTPSSHGRTHAVSARRSRFGRCGRAPQRLLAVLRALWGGAECNPQCWQPG